MISLSKRVVLGAASLLMPAAAAVGLSASAASASAAPHSAMVHTAAAPRVSQGVSASGALQEREANVTWSGGTYGKVYLCYYPTARTVYTIVKGDGNCNGEVFCGGAEVYNNDTGANKSCDIPQGGSSCSTGTIDDANTTSYASADIILTSNGSKVARGSTTSF